MEILIKAYNEAEVPPGENSAKVKRDAFEKAYKEQEEYIKTTVDFEVWDYPSDQEGPVVNEDATKKRREDEKKYLDAAKKQCETSIKNAENLAKAQAAKALAKCIQSVKIPAEEKQKKSDHDIEKAL